MFSLVPKLLVIGASVPAMVWLTMQRAAGDVTMAYVHAGVAAAAALVLAVLGILSTRAVIAEGASRAAAGASKARELGYVWAWAALAVLATYLSGAASWREWWHFMVPFALVAMGCFWFAATLDRDAAAGIEDEPMLQLSRWLAIGQLVGMILTMVGLVIDGKMTRFLAPRKGWEDWPANNYFFFGALALAILSLHAISAQAKSRSAAAAASGAGANG